MAVSQADMNSIRVNVLGTTVDAPGATWTTAPPANANRLNTAERIITRAINALDTNVTNAMGGTNGFNTRFDTIIGNEQGGDQAAWDSIGMNLLQAVAALIAGGIGPGPQTVPLEFVFADPLDDGEYEEVTVTADCTIPADFAGAEYEGTPVTEDMIFELTLEPAGTVIGEMTVDANSDSMAFAASAATDLHAGDTLRLTVAVAAQVSPGAIVTIMAQKKAVAPDVGGRYIHEQSTPSNAWTIQHDLGFAHVLPQVVSDSGNTIIADITYLSNDSCRLNFATAVSGTAILRK